MHQLVAPELVATRHAGESTRTDLVFFQSFARAYRQLTHKIFSALRKLIRQVLVVREAVCLKNGAAAIQSPTMVGVNNNHLLTPVWIILSCPEYYQQWLTVRQQSQCDGRRISKSIYIYMYTYINIRGIQRFQTKQTDIMPSDRSFWRAV